MRRRTDGGRALVHHSTQTALNREVRFDAQGCAGMEWVARLCRRCLAPVGAEPKPDFYFTRIRSASTRGAPFASGSIRPDTATFAPAFTDGAA